MIRKQIELVEKKLKEQVHAVFGERRSRRGYREYLEHLYSVQSFTKDRQLFMLSVTMAHRALYELWRDGGQQEVWNIISDGKTLKKEE